MLILLLKCGLEGMFLPTMGYGMLVVRGVTIQKLRHKLHVADISAMLRVRQVLEVANELLFGERPRGAGPRLAADGTLNVPPDGFGLGLKVGVT